MAIALVQTSPPSDTEVANKRNAGSRILLVVSLTLALVLFSCWLGDLWGNTILGGYPFVVHCMRLLGFLVGTELVKRLLPNRMLVHNDENSAYVTQDLVTNLPIAYGPGVHASSPLEQRNAQGNYSLRAVTVLFEVTVVTGDDVVKIEGNFGFARSLRHITTSLGINPGGAQEKANGLIEGFLTNWPRTTGNQKIDDLNSNLDGLNEALDHEFVKQGAEPQAFEVSSGFRITSVTITTIRLPEAVEKALAGLAESDKIQQIVAKHFGMTLDELKAARKAGTIHWEEYKGVLDRAMATSGNATQVNHVFDGRPPAGTMVNVGGGDNRGNRN